MINAEKLNKINETAGQRCTAALSKLVDREITAVFSQPVITNVEQVSLLIGSQELGIGIYLSITGSVTGSGLFLFPQETSFNLCDLGRKKEFRTTQELSSLDEAFLKEVGNIVLGNYLAVLSNELKAEIVEGMPEFSSGMFGAMIEEVIANFAKNAPEGVVAKIELMFQSMRMKGYLLILFGAGEIEDLLNAL